jgi:hypothetical protein
VESRPEPPAAPASVRAQLLATEHWSLLATRSMAQSEVLSRITSFLMLVSSSIVGLALVGQVTHFDTRFLGFALALLSALLVIGALTQMRCGNFAVEDLAHVIGMNRLRAAYLEIDPSLARYLMTGARDDSESVWRTYNPLLGTNMVFNVLASSTTFISFVTAGLAAALGALLAVALAAPGWLIVVAAAAGALLYLGVWMLLSRRSFRAVARREVRFPAPER